MALDRISLAAFALASLVSMDSAFAAQVDGYDGEVCEQRLNAGASEPLRAFLGRRFGPARNLMHGGVDWLAVNKKLNPAIKDDTVRAGAPLTIVTPRLPQVPVNPKATCSIGGKPVKAQPTVIAVGPTPKTAAPKPLAKAAPVPSKPVSASPSPKTAYAPPKTPTSSPKALAASSTPRAPVRLPPTTSEGSPMAPTRASQSPVPHVPSAPQSAKNEISAQRAYDQRVAHDRTSFEATKLEMPALASYSGVRFAMPIIQDSVLLPKTRMINVFAQVKDSRGGGLTVFGDYVPRVSDALEGHTFELSWQRFTVGYAFGMNFDNILRRLEVTPRVGFWNVDGRFPKRLTGGGLGAKDFAFKRQSLGLAFAADFEAPLGTSVRTWYASDAATALSGKKDDAGASSRRLGLDFFMPGFSFALFGKKLECLGLLYLMRDTMFLTESETSLGDIVAAKPLANTSAADETFYALYYAGTGITFTF